MTNKNFFANQIFYCSSAAMIAAAGTLWLLSACVVETFSADKSILEFPCTVESGTPVESTSSQNICRIQSPVKISFQSSSRRPDQNIPAPFIFAPDQKFCTSADNSASITPALLQNIDPATYVRAGPLKKSA